MPVPFSLGPFHRQAEYGIPIGGEVLFGIRQSADKDEEILSEFLLYFFPSLESFPATWPILHPDLSSGISWQKVRRACSGAIFL